MKKYAFKLPGYFYALGPVYAESMAEARQRIRDWLEVDRLPAGIEIWHC